MKRKLSYLLLIIISMFIYSGEVGAADCNNYACKTCTYSKNDNVVFSFEISADAEGNLTLTDKTEGSYSFYENNLIAKDFYNKQNYTLECMNKIYARLDGGRNGLTASLYQTKCDKCIEIAKTGESGNNKKVNTKLTKSCDFYGSDASGQIKITLTSDGTNLTAEATRGYKVNIQNMTAFSLHSNCSDVVAYVSCGSSQNDKYCTISSEKLGVMPGDNGQPGNDTPGAGEHNGDDEEKKPEKEITDDETLKIVKRIYNLIKILIPVLIIVLSTADFLKVVLMDDEKSYKNAWDKFIKRLIIGIIFFLVPVLVSFILKYSGLNVEQTALEIFK